MTRRYASTIPRNATFTWQIAAKSGVLGFGVHHDFLITIVLAKQEKRRWSLLLPESSLRVQLCYPTGYRISKDDIKAALRALADKSVEAAVHCRMFSAAGVPPAALCARTERTACENTLSDDSANVAFCQAGVVAPPDSPDLGIPCDFDCVPVLA